MAKLLYALLLIFSGFSVGCAVVGTYVSWKLSKLGARIARHAIPLLIGVVVTQGTLLIRLIQLGTTQTSFAGWLYIAGLIIQSIGLIGTTQFAITRLAELESHSGGES